MDYIIKRDGSRQEFKPEEVVNRLKNICLGENGLKPLPTVNYSYIARQTISRIYPDIHSDELDEISAALAYPLEIDNYEYGHLASRLIISNHIRKVDHVAGSYTTRSLLWNVYALMAHNLGALDSEYPLIDPGLLAFIDKYETELNQIIQYDRDYLLTYTGFSKLYSMYLMNHVYQIDNTLVKQPLERPQHLYMRVAIGIHMPQIPYPDPEANIESRIEFAKAYVNSDILARVKSTYDLLSEHYVSHATPTLINAGTRFPQLSSCFLLAVKGDSLEDIFDYFKDTAMISKWSGGIGSHVSNIRPAGSGIRRTAGVSNGLPAMLKVPNQIVRYVDQGGGKRPGSHAVYIEPWHADIEAVLHLKTPRGNPEHKAQDLFYALWVPDEFMRTIEREEYLKATGQNANPTLWCLMDPSRCPGLSDAYDSVLSTKWLTDEQCDPQKYAFTYLYRKYTHENKIVRRISASELWKLICSITEESGVPYQCRKDAANRKTNQSNRGTIKSSNLCTEIYEYSSADETAVCNLASICWPKFIVYTKPEHADAYPYSTGFKLKYSDANAWFDFERLHTVVRETTYNLNKIIDKNYYPIESARTSNMRNRPIGIGLQGQADTLSKLWLEYGSPEALKFDAIVSEHTYYASLCASCEIAQSDGPYPTYAGSPISEGQLQFDLWVREHSTSDRASEPGPLVTELTCDWESLRSKILKHGVRNSLCVALMPTGTTSTVLSNSPCCEPHNGLIYVRKDKHSESYVCNTDLINVLKSIGLWTPKIKQELMSSPIGSIQDIAKIPADIKANFKTAFDVGPKAILNHSLAKSPFIDQGISMSLFISNPTHAIITQAHMYSWRRGLKTGCYYLRRKPPIDAKKIQIRDASSITDSCSRNGDCTSCGA